MFRKIENHRYTAALATIGEFAGRLVTVSYDDGWETLVADRTVYDTPADARAALPANIWEEFDPNADLKAAGLKWDASRGIYC